VLIACTTRLATSRQLITYHSNTRIRIAWYGFLDRNWDVVRKQMDANTKKTKTTKRKSHVSSDEDYFLKISAEQVEFLDQGAVQKPKKPSSRKVQTPCWKFFDIPQGTEQSTNCKKCAASIICVEKLRTISTTRLNAYQRAKYWNQLDVGASFRGIGQFENPEPRQQMTSMLQKVSKDEVNVERYDKKFTTMT